MLVSPAEKHPAIKALGRYSSKPEQHGCDILFYVPRKGEILTYGVQRKELKDFVASAGDGRLAYEVKQIAASVEQALLIVEGVPRWTMDGKLMTNGFGAQWDVTSHLGLLFSLQSRGVLWCGTGNAEETADACRVFQAWCRKEKHRSLDARPGPVVPFGRAGNKDWERHLVMGLQGVGAEWADAIIHQLGMPIGLRVTAEELAEVYVTRKDGGKVRFGGKKAERVVAALGGMQ